MTVVIGANMLWARQVATAAARTTPPVLRHARYTWSSDVDPDNYIRNYYYD